MGKTTVKAISLKYGTVGGAVATSLMGVLKGLTIGQDTPDSTEIDAEFYDSPFDIFYDGKPVTMTFELANYDLSELPALFGGSFNDATNEYEGAHNAYTTEHAWEIEFQRGHKSLYIYRGLTIGTIKKDADGALNYSVTITALIYNDGEHDHMYKIVGAAGGAATYSAVSTSSAGYSEKNPKTEGWYEKNGSDTEYRLTWDTAVVDGKTYYTKS